jgi:uncharacterized protein (TIGR02594 family)
MVEMRAPWMRIAQALEGESEFAGSLANPRIIEMFKVAGCPDTSDFRSDETAWCAAFANSCLRLSGYSGTNSALASSFANFGSDLGGTPQAGCVVVFWPLAGTSTGHVGFFVGADDKSIKVLGGNQSDKVKISSFPKSKWRGFRWPSETAPIPEEHVLPTILTLAPEEVPDHIRVATAPPSVPVTLAVPIAADNFSRVQPIIDHWEGGFSDHPLDPGGPTNMGITQETLKRWRKHDVSKNDVKNLQRDEAWQIFKAFYWEPLRCDEMPIALAMMTYNAGVNSGARWLQQALNKQGADLDVDGSVGPLTLNACARFDVAHAVADFGAIQESFLRSLATFSTFGNGWMNRLNDVKSKALELSLEPVVVADRVPSVVLQPTLQSILEKFVASLMETFMVATTAIPSTQITTTGAQIPSQLPVANKTPGSPDDILSLAQQLAALLQKLNVPDKPSTGAVTQPADQLRQLAELITVILPRTKPILGQVNGALGETIGNLLNGKKSAIGIIGALLTSLLGAVPSGSGLGQILAMITPAAGLSGFAMPIFIAMTAWGVLGKFEKWTRGTAPLPAMPLPVPIASK